MKQTQIYKSVGLGIISTFFFSIGLIINSVLAWHGNNWAWTASLRFLLLIPVLAVIVAAQSNLKHLLRAFKVVWVEFLLWGSIGFAVYYALLSYAVQFVPGWLVIASFQTTIIAGLLLSPLIYTDHRAVIPKKAFLFAGFLVVGLVVLQLDRVRSVADIAASLTGICLALVAAFLWPLGNRMMMLKLEHTKIQLNALQRVLGMSIGSLPVLIALAVYGFIQSGAPDNLQVTSSLIAVLFSGVLGTVIFFKSMQMVKGNAIALANVEATQVLSVIFTLIGEIIFKGMHWPGFYANVGFVLICAGLLVYTSYSVRTSRALMLNQPNKCLNIYLYCQSVVKRCKHL